MKITERTTVSVGLLIVLFSILSTTLGVGATSLVYVMRLEGQVNSIGVTSGLEQRELRERMTYMESEQAKLHGRIGDDLKDLNTRMSRMEGRKR